MTDTHAPVQTPDGTAQETCAASTNALTILSHCHEHILDKLKVLEDVGQQLADDGEFSDARLAMLCDVVTMLDTAIPIHTADEEQSLFPVLRAAPMFAGTEGTPMDCMESEHGGHRQLMAELKRGVMLRDATATARSAQAMVADYRGHIQKEEEILYPLARDLIDDATLADMAAVMHQRRVDAGILKTC